MPRPAATRRRPRGRRTDRERCLPWSTVLSAVETVWAHEAAGERVEETAAERRSSTAGQARSARERHKRKRGERPRVERRALGLLLRAVSDRGPGRGSG